MILRLILITNPIILGLSIFFGTVVIWARLSWKSLVEVHVAAVYRKLYATNITVP